MFTVSLHGVKVSAARGMYAEEHTLYNQFEVDVDITTAAGSMDEVPFIDYTVIRQAVADAFEAPYDLLEDFIRHIFKDLKSKFPVSDKICIAVRKMHPPMPGEVRNAQVKFEG